MRLARTVTQLAKGMQAAAAMRERGPLSFPAEAVTDPCRVRPARVLLVDNDPASLEIYRDFFQFLGLLVAETADPSNAVELAIAEPPDVVVLDLDHAGRSAWRIARDLRATPQTCRAVIVAVCGTGQRGAAHDAHDAGCDIFLTKPWHPTELVDVLRWTGVRIARGRHTRRKGAKGFGDTGS
jgi:two-component system, cell cycle response regulator DivK